MVLFFWKILNLIKTHFFDIKCELWHLKLFILNVWSLCTHDDDFRERAYECQSSFSYTLIVIIPHEYFFTLKIPRSMKKRLSIKITKTFSFEVTFICVTIMSVPDHIKLYPLCNHILIYCCVTVHINCYKLCIHRNCC